MNDALRDKLAQLPFRPGVYIFKNSQGKIIYVGKAKSLKNRVGSYFHTNLNTETKTGSLVARINDIDTIEVESEFDAVILEAELIKKYKPKYNIIQKDDKTFIFIVIRNELVKIDSREIVIPKLITARKTELMPKDVKFGPYPDAATARFVVRTLRKIFPYRDCSYAKFTTYHKRRKPCLYGHLQICPAPCVNYSEQDLINYKKTFDSIKKVLRGGAFSVLRELQRKMNYAARTKNYEEAVMYRDLISKFNYIRQKSKSPEVYMENPMLMEDVGMFAMKSLQETLPILKALPQRIECYDISNISGKEAVGSLVVAENGQINKKEYKRFKIKYKSTPDDFEMLHEVLTRRMSHHSKLAGQKIPWPDPDLLVIDGGKGQVSAVLDVINKTSLNVPVIGLAKKYETIVYWHEGAFVELVLDKSNPGLTLLIRLRDEAHRFAQDYHHKLRAKIIQASV
jgi:excinuclease ABC subunit C